MNFKWRCEEKSHHHAADSDMSMSICSSASIAENPMLAVRAFMSTQ